MSEALQVMHNQAAQTFEVFVDGHRAHLDYRPVGEGVLDYHHTFVPDALRGRGIAAELTQAALAYARAEGYQVQPSCSYVEVYMKRQAKRGE